MVRTRTDYIQLQIIMMGLVKDLFIL